MKKFTVVIIAIAMIVIGTVLVFGQTTEKSGEKEFGKRGMHNRQGMRGKRGKRGHRGDMMGGRMFRHLDLTDAQKTQMQAITKTSRESSKLVREQVQANRQQLSALSENGNFNESQISALAKKQGDLHAQMIVQRQKTKAQMFAVLTADQKAKLVELKADFKKKMEERKAKWAEKQSEKAVQ